MAVETDVYQTRGSVCVRNKTYYVVFDYHGIHYDEKLYPVKQDTTIFIRDIALGRMEDIIEDIEMEEACAVYFKKV